MLQSMARLIPSVYVDNHSRGEERIFNAFEHDASTKDWVVLHSFDLPCHQTQGEGEVDFVVLIPDMGVLCLEIKASENISRKGGLWRYGNGGHFDPKGPFKQIKDNTYSLMRRVKSENRNLKYVPFFGLVVFTNFNFRSKQPSGLPEWDNDDFIDAKDIDSGKLGVILKEIFLSQTEKFKLKLGDFNAENFAELSAMLRPDFDLIASPRERIFNSEIEARRYTEEQFKILDALAANDKIVVDGLAGTGKTVLAIEYARRRSKKENVLFLASAKELGEFIASETRLEPPHFAGSIQDFEDFIKTNKNTPAYDFLILDEAQDFIDKKYYDILNPHLKNGLENGRWIMFGDYYSRTDTSKEKLQNLKQKYHPAIYKLSENCRNPFDVAKLVEIISGEDLNYSDIKRKYSGAKPKISFYENIKDETTLIAAELESLLKQGAPPESIALISLKNEEAFQDLIKSKYWGQQLSNSSAKNKIFHGKLDDFKGMEADFVLLCDLENINTPEDKRAFYIGATRTKSYLSIFATPNFKPFFDKLN